MRWTRGERSKNLEDRRGQSAGRGGGGIGGIPIGAKGGIGGTLVLLVLGLVFGRDLISGSPGTQQNVQQGSYQESAQEKELFDFISFVLDDVQETWTKKFPTFGKTYRDAKLVVFTDNVRSGCGFAESAMGPFYCPADQKAYIDLGFYQQLASRFGAPGDFAQAYVLAHEIGHHIQNITGINEKVRRAQKQNPSLENDYSIRMELQADCLAGVWGHSTKQRNLLEEGDVEEGLAAAAAVGDDRLQKQSTGRVNPETWTHGSSAQRAKWFKIGFRSGEFSDCDTFAVSNL